MEFRKAKKTAAVFALVCTMGLACMTGCTGEKKQQDPKQTTTQSQVTSKNHNEVQLGEQEINLTETEYQLLLMLMKKPNRVHSAREIYEQVWKEQYYSGANSIVMVHIKNLRRKIETHPQNPCHIVTIWGKGYQFRKQEIL